MCGREIHTGVVCDKCDKPKKAKNEAPQSAGAHALDPFPKAPIVPFPVENASLAITSVVDLLIAAGIPAVLLGPDKSIKFGTDAFKSLFGDADLAGIEAQTGIRVGDLSVRASSGVRIADRNYACSLVPMSGGASGAVLVFRETQTFDEIPLDAAPSLPNVSDVVRRVADRFIPYADLKNVQLQVDAPDVEHQFSDQERLAEALAIFMDNALHYVPNEGQVVIGVRAMEHKGRPLLLFFVMDNGPLVPESLRQVIFEPSFVWNPTGLERTGRGLFKAREFATSHSGSVWVESKTGKACTFFLRVRPDGDEGSASSGNVF